MWASASLYLKAHEGSEFDQEERTTLNELLDSYKYLFDNYGPPTRFAEHHIESQVNTPMASPPYRVTLQKKEFLRNEVDRMLERLSAPSTSIGSRECRSTSEMPLLPSRDSSTGLRLASRV